MNLVASQRHALLAALVVIGFTTFAAASKPRILVERVDTTRCASAGEIDVYAVEVELEGTPRSMPAAEYRMVVDNKTIPSVATNYRRFSESENSIQLIVLLQLDLTVAPHLLAIQQGGADFLARWRNQATHNPIQVGLMTYGWEPKVLLEPGEPQAAETALLAIRPIDEGGSLALLPAIEKAIAELNHLPRAQRRVVVLVSDGLNDDLSQQAFIAVGDVARDNDVALYPIAFSPFDDREPLRNLGELALRSRGTFRWAAEPADLSRQWQNLFHELTQQWIFTFPMSDRCQANHRLQISRGMLRSNVVDVRIVAADATPQAATGGTRGIYLIGLVVLSVLAVFLVARLNLKRSNRS